MHNVSIPKKSRRCATVVSMTVVAMSLGLSIFGCGGDEPLAPAASPPEVSEADITEARAASEGSVAGKPVELREAAADGLNRMYGGSTPREVVLAGIRIELSSGRGMCSAFTKNAQKLELHVQHNKGDLEPGSRYPIGTNDDGERFSSAVYWTTDAECQMATAKTNATSGFIKILRATQQRVQGEYDLQFGRGGHVKGNFDAPTCLKRLLYGSDRVACE